MAGSRSTSRRGSDRPVTCPPVGPRAAPLRPAPAGVGSTSAVAAVRRAAGAAKAGHGGTLDPLASGMLPIALGEATKTVQWAMDGGKIYRFTVRWGQATEPADAEGPPIAQSDVRPDEAAICAALPAFTGD